MTILSIFVEETRRTFCCADRTSPTSRHHMKGGRSQEARFQCVTGVTAVIWFATENPQIQKFGSLSRGGSLLATLL